MTTPVVTADDVDAATARLDGIVERTPLQLNVRLSALTGADVWVKREDLQPVRSYKLRGAYNRWRMARAKKKFQVYLRKRDDRGPWVN